MVEINNQRVLPDMLAVVREGIDNDAENQKSWL